MRHWLGIEIIIEKYCNTKQGLFTTTTFPSYYLVDIFSKSHIHD